MNYDEKSRSGPKDIFFFDIGYHIAFNQIIYTLVFIYAIVCPMVSFIGGLYFLFKYYIDAYNLTKIYPKEYDGKGEISKHTYYLAHISIYL